jgi:hypothetical protein
VSNQSIMKKGTGRQRLSKNRRPASTIDNRHRRGEVWILVALLPHSLLHIYQEGVGLIIELDFLTSPQTMAAMGDQDNNQDYSTMYFLFMYLLILNRLVFISSLREGEQREKLHVAKGTSCVATPIQKIQARSITRPGHHGSIPWYFIWEAYDEAR